VASAAGLAKRFSCRCHISTRIGGRDDRKSGGLQTGPLNQEIVPVFPDGRKSFAVPGDLIGLENNRDLCRNVGDLLSVGCDVAEISVMTRFINTSLSILMIIAMELTAVKHRFYVKPSIGTIEPVILFTIS